jgi:hypothetical protein
MSDCGFLSFWGKFPHSDNPVSQAESDLSDVRVHRYTSASLGGLAPDRCDAQPSAASGGPLIVNLSLDLRIELVF